MKVVSTIESREKRMDVGQTPGVGADEREDEISGAALRGQIAALVAVSAFSAPNDFLTNDNA